MFQAHIFLGLWLVVESFFKGKSKIYIFSCFLQFLSLDSKCRLLRDRTEVATTCSLVGWSLVAVWYACRPHHSHGVRICPHLLQVVSDAS